MMGTRRSHTRAHTNTNREPVRVIIVVVTAVIVGALCATGAASETDRTVLPLSGIGVGA